MGGRNGFEALPDTLVVSLLSKLPSAADVQRAASSCRRLRMLAREVEELVFIAEPRVWSNRQTSTNFELNLSLMFARANRGCLKRLKCEAAGVVPAHAFNEGSVLSWIAMASSSLEKIIVEDGFKEDVIHRMKAASLCPSLQVLKVKGFGPKQLEPSFVRECDGGFKVLRKLHLETVSMNDTSLTQLVSLCTALQDFQVHGLTGVEHVQLQSSTVERVDLTVFAGWRMMTDDGGFLDMSLVMPALQDLTVKDLQNSLVVKDAPLQKLLLRGCGQNLAIDLGSKANLHALTIESDSWPARFVGTMKTVPANWFLTNLSLTRRESLRVLEIPFIESHDPVPLESAHKCFQNIAELRSLSIPESLLSACGFGRESNHSQSNFVDQILQGVSFKNLRQVKLMLDDGEDTVGCVRFLKAILERSTKIVSLTIHADAGLDDYTVPGEFVSQLLGLQFSYPKTRVNIRLPTLIAEY